MKSNLLPREDLEHSPAAPERPRPVTSVPANEKPFEGQTIVFTGKLSLLPRKEAQELVRKLGGVAADRVTAATTCLVMGEEGYLSGIAKSNKLKRAEKVNEEGGHVRIMSESEFLGMAGMEDKSALETKYYSLERILRVFPNLRPDLVKYFAYWGLFKPAVKTNAHQYYEFRDLLVFRQIEELLQQGMPLRAIGRRLQEAIEPSPQISLQFEEFATKGAVISIQRPEAPSPQRTAEQWYEIGYHADGNPESYDQAVEAYENALAIDPHYVDAMINLANILFHKRELRRAAELLEKAIQEDAENYMVCYNLANIYDELGNLQQAVGLYRRALLYVPQYEPAIFNLALVCEKLGMVEEARQNWRKYLEIEPEGEWAVVAKEHLRNGSE